jgi:hypothetical protein
VNLSPSPIRSAERCAVRAHRRDDVMLGTAFPAARLLLVEQPLAWGPQGLRDSRFDTETALALEARGREAGVRVQAIRRPGRQPAGERRRWALVDTRNPGSLRWGDYGADAELLDLPLDGSVGELDPEPLYLVCTHGKHDPCCAQRGRPAAAALAALRPDRVWQASHLGGCRFAPTVLVLPLGLMYGQIAPSHVGELVVASDRGEVLPQWLRGRIGIAPAAQAAVGHVHAQLGIARSRDVRVLEVEVVDRGCVRVRVDTPSGEHEVTVLRERIDADGLTCAAPGPSWYVAHHPTGLTPV